MIFRNQIIYLNSETRKLEQGVVGLRHTFTCQHCKAREGPVSHSVCFLSFIKYLKSAHPNRCTSDLYFPALEQLLGAVDDEMKLPIYAVYKGLACTLRSADSCLVTLLVFLLCHHSFPVPFQDYF